MLYLVQDQLDNIVVRCVQLGRACRDELLRKRSSGNTPLTAPLHACSQFLQSLLPVGTLLVPTTTNCPTQCLSLPSTGVFISAVDTSPDTIALFCICDSAMLKDAQHQCSVSGPA